MRIFKRLALRMGLVPLADLEHAVQQLDQERATAKVARGNFKAELARVRGRAEKLRTDTRTLFQKGFDFGIDPECIAGGSGCDHLGNIVPSCPKGCSPLRPQCTYNVCARGLQITEYPFR